MNRRQLTRALWSALAADPAGGIHAMQAGLLNAVDGWEKGAGGAVAPAVDAVLASLVRLEVALDGDSAQHAAAAPAETVTFMGERHKVCCPECAFLYQERCPDASHVNEEPSQ